MLSPHPKIHHPNHPFHSNYLYLYPIILPYRIQHPRQDYPNQVHQFRNHYLHFPHLWSHLNSKAIVKNRYPIVHYLFSINLFIFQGNHPLNSRYLLLLNQHLQEILIKKLCLSNLWILFRFRFYFFYLINSNFRMIYLRCCCCCLQII